MMNDIDEICDIIDALHDGSLTSCYGTFEALWVKVSCTYLAELIDKDFDYFYLKFLAVKNFDFEEYSGQKREIFNIHNQTDIYINLLSPKIESDYIIAYCEEGILSIQCESIEIFDQNKRSMSASELFQLADSYWSKK